MGGKEKTRPKVSFHSGYPLSPHFKMTFAGFEAGIYTSRAKHFTNSQKWNMMKIYEMLRIG